MTTDFGSQGREGVLMTDTSILIQRYGYSLRDVIALLAKVEPVIPVSVFSSTISPLQAIVLYLRNREGLGVSQIAKLLGRKYSVIWSVLKKCTELDRDQWLSDDYLIPCSVFCSRLTILESVVLFLHDVYELDTQAISKVIGRNPKTVWATVTRARKKAVRT